jgi:hypothetical protein
MDPLGSYPSDRQSACIGSLDRSIGVKSFPVRAVPSQAWTSWVAMPRRRCHDQHLQEVVAEEGSCDAEADELVSPNGYQATTLFDGRGHVARAFGGVVDGQDT